MAEARIFHNWQVSTYNTVAIINTWRGKNDRPVTPDELNPITAEKLRRQEMTETEAVAFFDAMVRNSR